MADWIRKGDRVKVIAGNDRGRAGEVLFRLGERLLIQGVNVRKKHLKGRGRGSEAGIVDRELPIHSSNVVLCSKDDEAIKVRSRLGKEGKKELFYKNKDGKEVVLREVGK